MKLFSTFAAQPFLHVPAPRHDGDEVPTPTPGAEDTQQQHTPPKLQPFTPEQKKRIDEIVVEAMGRAGREARSRVKELERELESLQSSSGLDAEAKAEVARLRAERDTLRAERTEGIIRDALMSVSAGFVDPALFCDLARKHVRVSDNGLEVIGADGQPLLDDELRPMTVSQLAKRIATERKYLVSGDMRGGTGSTESSGTPAVSNEAYLRTIFGKDSIPKNANALAKNDIKRYRALRMEAQKLGII